MYMNLFCTEKVKSVFQIQIFLNRKYFDLTCADLCPLVTGNSLVTRGDTATVSVNVSTSGPSDPHILQSLVNTPGGPDPAPATDP